MLYRNYMNFFKQYISLVLPRDVYGVVLDKNQVIIRINYNFIRQMSLFLRDHNLSLFKLLIDIVCIDYLNRKNRFEFSYVFLSLKYNSRVYVKFNVSEVESVGSLVSIYNNSDWYEREVWDMFGVFFQYHTDLRRILTDYGFNGFPLRKDFPLSGYLDVVYDPLVEQVKYIPVKFIQEFRVYNYKTPWGFDGDLEVNPVLLGKMVSFRKVLSNSLFYYFK